MYGSTQFLKLTNLTGYVYPYFADADRKEVFVQILISRFYLFFKILHQDVIDLPTK